VNLLLVLNLLGFPKMQTLGSSVTSFVFNPFSEEHVGGFPLPASFFDFQPPAGPRFSSKRSPVQVQVVAMGVRWTLSFEMSLLGPDPRKPGIA